MGEHLYFLTVVIGTFSIFVEVAAWLKSKILKETYTSTFIANENSSFQPWNKVLLKASKETII